MPARAMRLKIGGDVWVRCDEVKNGIHPTERYFSFTIPDQPPITGFAQAQDIRPHKVRAIVVGVVGKLALLAFPGELISATNPVPVPKTWLSQQAA